MKAKLRRGRPLGDSVDRKESIANAAFELFNSLGFDKTSIRLIAERASVDPKLVSHYFGSKSALFAKVLSIPPQADSAMGVLLHTPIEKWGEQIVDILIDDSGFINIPQMVGVIKSASNEPGVAATIREFYIRQSLEPVLESIGLDHHKARASALSSLLIGFTFSDQILGIPIGNEAQVERRKNLIATLIQTILTKELN